MSMVWALVVTGAALGVPIIIYEQWIHLPAVNRETERVLAEQGTAPNGGAVTSVDNSSGMKGPPSVS